MIRLKKFDYKEIGYYGKPITTLTRNELLAAFAELAAIIYECSVKDKKIEKSIFIKTEESNYFNKKKEQNQERKKEYFTFGKYNGQRIEKVYQENPKYCEYIVELPTVIKYQNPSVQTIRDLIITNHPLVESF